MDFVAERATLTFDLGVTQQTYRLSILPDNLNEAVESFGLCLQVADESTTLVGVHNTSVITITDDDGKFVCVCVSVCMCVCVRTYVHVCVCTCVCMCTCACVVLFVCVTSLSCNPLLTAIIVDFATNSTVIAEDGEVVAVNVTVSGGISDLPITLSLTTMSSTATNGECKTDR